MFGRIKQFILLLKGVREQYRLDHLLIYFFYLLVLWVVGTNLVYFSERIVLAGFPELYHKSVFSNYAASYWNIVIYLLSGIEDKEPLTIAGKAGAFFVLLSSIVLVGIFTGTLTSIIIERVNNRQYIKLKPVRGKFSDHVVICGSNSSLRGIVTELTGIGRVNIVIVSEQAFRMKKMCRGSNRLVWGINGDPSDFDSLKMADIDTARGIVVLSTDEVTPCESDSRSLITALSVRQLNPDIYICAQIRNTLHRQLFYDAEIDEVIAIGDFFNRLLTQTINIKGIGKLYRLISKSGVDFGQIFKIPVPGRYLRESLTYAEIRNAMINSDDGLTLIGIEKNSGPNHLKQRRNFGYIEINPRKIKQKYSQIDASYRPSAEDRLIVIGGIG